MSTTLPNDQPLWAITSYFNPVGYRNRRTNYSMFRRRLSVPLATVELSFDGEFELNSTDAEILIQISGGDVMWQKERLLNIAVDSLPQACRNILWLDCDIVFQRGDWVAEVNRQLENVSLLQPYSLVHNLPRSVSPEQWEIEPSEAIRPSVAGLISQGVSAAQCLGDLSARFPGIRAPGHAWAARRDLITQHRFYDACIVGGGDTALACAAYGVFEILPQMHAYNQRAFEHYLRWARPFHRSVQGQVSLVAGDLLHLWHGEMNDRLTRKRHRDLASFDFDPSVDIALAQNNCWHWNSNKPALHEYVANYFVTRNEDGLLPTAVAA